MFSEAPKYGSINMASKPGVTAGALSYKRRIIYVVKQLVYVPIFDI